MPLLSVKAKSVNEAWQRALAAVLKNGDDIKTEYDNPDDPPSKDATVAIEITEPFDHPLMMRGRRMKIRSNAGNEWEIYGCEADTFLVGSIQSNYIEEVLDGINDKYLHESEKSFPYSYHDRIFKYKPFALEDTLYNVIDINTHKIPDILAHKKLKIDEYTVEDDEKNIKTWEFRKNKLIELDGDRIELFGLVEYVDNGGAPIEFIQFPPMNQLDPITHKLSQSPYSRRCQFVTWRPYADPFRTDPPCLQRGWFRVVNGKLKMQTTWRSRDLFRAWEANVNGMLYIQKTIADKLDRELGSYVDFSNSLHIYGSTFRDLLDMLERMRERKNVIPELDEQIDPLRELIT